MSFRTQVLVWVGFFAVSVFLAWIFRPILLPFVLGMIVAYLLNPVVNWMQRVRIGRPWGSAIILLAMIALIVSLFVIVMPPLLEQAVGLITGLPGYISSLQEMAQQVIPQFAEWLGPERTRQLEASLAELSGRSVEFIGSITAQLATSSLNVFTTIALLVLTPVVAFYLLIDWEGMLQRVDDLLPRDHADEIRGVLKDIDRAMAGVIRGQGGVVLVLSIYYATALTTAGLSYGLAIGLIGGALSFIPYVGFAVGFVLSMTVAVVQFWPDQWPFIGIVFGVYVIGQFLEANILYPKLVGQSININAVWMMFALFAFGLVLGFVGLLLAVPLTAIAGVLTRYALRKYQQSTLYRGASDPIDASTEATSSVHLDSGNAPTAPAAAAPLRAPAGDTGAAKPVSGQAGRRRATTK